MATRTNYTYDEITAYTKQLLNSYAPDEILSVLGDLSDATAGLDLTSSDVSLWVSGLNRMRITDKATLEYLNYFSERGLNVYEALSQALGVQESAVQDRFRTARSAARRQPTQFWTTSASSMAACLNGWHPAMRV